MATTFPFDELERAFNMVCDSEDWRGPVDYIIEGKDREVVAEAVEFYTATEASFEEKQGGQLRVTAPGYRAGPAGP